MNFEIGQIVKVIPDDWRKLKSFIGKVREITQSGYYISYMLGKKNASINSVYYGHEEVASYE